MAWFIIIGTLCAWGVLCAVWIGLGWMLPMNAESRIFLCTAGTAEDHAILRYRLLHGLGLVKGPLFIVNSRLPPQERAILMHKHSDVIFCSTEELISRLELECNSIE